MNCSHNWTVTSECPRCLRAALDRAETERAQAQRELSARAARPLAIRQRDEAVARAEAAEARWSAEQATALEALRQAEAAEARVRELEDITTRQMLVERDAAERLVALRAENATLRAIVARLGEWTHEFGAALKPKGADTFGEGVRECKAQVARILDALAARGKDGAR